jgi:hypothetical protein
MPNTIASLYPLAKLPTLGHGSLSADERTRLQCAYIWVQTHGTCGPAPPSATASYSELWFMLQYLEQLQILCKSLLTMMPDYVDAHKSRYAAAAGALPCDFGAIMYHDFKPLKSTVAFLATVHFNESRR